MRLTRVHARQHIADHSAGEARGVQLLDQPDALDGGVGVVPMAAGAAVSLEQVLFLVVAQCPDAHSRLRGDLTDAHRPSPARADRPT